MPGKGEFEGEDGGSGHQPALFEGAEGAFEGEASLIGLDVVLRALLGEGDTHQLHSGGELILRDRAYL